MTFYSVIFLKRPHSHVSQLPIRLLYSTESSSPNESSDGFLWDVRFLSVVLNKSAQVQSFNSLACDIHFFVSRENILNTEEVNLLSSAGQRASLTWSMPSQEPSLEKSRIRLYSFPDISWVHSLEIIIEEMYGENSVVQIRRSICSVTCANPLSTSERIL